MDFEKEFNKLIPVSKNDYCLLEAGKWEATDKHHYIRTIVFATYAPSTDMTFVLKEVWGGTNGNKYPYCKSTELLGFHYGLPNQDSMHDIGMKAEY